MSKEIKKIPLSTEALDRVLNYLASKPYIEVFELIGIIHAEAQANTQVKPKNLPEEVKPKEEEITNKNI